METLAEFAHLKCHLIFAGELNCLFLTCSSQKAF
jgi:hypothetical protein